MSEEPLSKNEKSIVARKEEQTLEFWQKNDVFQKSLKKDAPEGDFIFYDGPPYATGLPHYGHVLPSTIKDVVPRYKTMQGFRVPRRWGWDCHGLPIENLIEKELGLKSKKEIEDYGIEKFNDAAKASVLRYADEWKKTIPRIGRWVDMEDDYKTMDPSYTESVWWVFKNLYDKGLVYESYKSMHLCPRCETTLANFEVNQGYKDITDISVYVKFELVDEPGTFFLAWTTTPWTLPGNVALAVGNDIDYVIVECDGEKLILAKERVEDSLTDKKYLIVKELKGSDLVGKSYKPVFDYYSKDESLKNKENGWKVYPADFVTTTDGTGIVHIAPAFGEDDMRLGQEKNLPFVQHVSKDGKFRPEVTDFAGQYVKPKDDHQKADVEIIKYLAGTGTLFAKKKIVHSYPHCWRCDTPLLNYASNSWFVKVTDLKDKLLSNNQRINWTPEHIRDGRFGKWLEGARDWAVSRQRFWGAPLPVWQCSECKKTEVLGTVKELAELLPKSKNEYFVMRHGTTVGNGRGAISYDNEEDDHLTEEGKSLVHASAEKLEKKKIDLIVTSPFARTRETAEMVASELGISPDAIVYDARLQEMNVGEFSGKTWNEYHAQFPKTVENFTRALPGGESYADVKRRMVEVLLGLEESYKGKNILIVTHGGPAWLLISGVNGFAAEQSLDLIRNKKDFHYLENAEFVELPVRAFPRNNAHELDLHRPYIDQVEFNCSCGGKMKRVPDVFDVWFDSGSMPYAQYAYTGGEKPHANYPTADFIAEGLDQTRGWFYTLHVLATALFDKPAFANVAVNGLILAEDGQKMSKRLKNYPEVDYVLNKYGADALRFYLLDSPAVRAEDLRFSEAGVDEVLKKTFGRLRNVVSFYKMYSGDAPAPDEANSKNVLDLWIVSRLNELLTSVDKGMEKYELDRAVKEIPLFVDDLSTWYLRRSRDRMKEGGADGKNAVETLGYVLKTFAKILAPFTPFIAEEIYQELRSSNDPESVHLETWPKVGEIHSSVLQNTAITRSVVSAGLELRSKANIKVRQPLASLTIVEKLDDEYLELIKDEVNVKEVAVGTELSLDTNITPELAREGEYRDLLREVQDLRKEKGLNPSDIVTISLPEKYKEILVGFEEDFKKTVSASAVNYGSENIEIK